MHSGAEASSSSTLENKSDSPVGSGSQDQQVGRGARQSAYGDLVNNDVVDRPDAGGTQIWTLQQRVHTRKPNAKQTESFLSVL